MQAETAQPSAEELAFREAISHFATGVTVITTMHEGRPAGMTASAVASLSLDPVLLLVCISNTLATHSAIEHSRRFVVNVLGEGQEQLALQFARSRPDKFDGARSRPDKFDGVALRQEQDLPVLEDAIAHFLCDVHERFPGGDHSIFIGHVRECGSTPGKRPLVYFRSRFGSLRDRERELLHEAVGWDVASLGGLGNIHVEPR